MDNNINQLDNNLETYQEILKNDRTCQNNCSVVCGECQNFIKTGNEYVRCYDRLGIEITEGDLVNVQSDGVHEVYRKEDGQLYFKPYNKESRVSEYFSNDLEKKPKYKLVGECKGNDGNGCFMESCGHNCGCFKKVLIDYSENKITGITYPEDEVRRIAYNAYNYGQLDNPSEGKFNKFFSESKKTL